MEDSVVESDLRSDHSEERLETGNGDAGERLGISRVDLQVIDAYLKSKKFGYA